MNDIQILTDELVKFRGKLGFDVKEIVLEKIKRNGEKYPVGSFNSRNEGVLCTFQ